MGIQFFETRMGKMFFEGTMPSLLHTLKDQNELLKEQNNLLKQQISSQEKMIAALSALINKEEK